jgi:hypothetical protein
MMMVNKHGSIDRFEGNTAVVAFDDETIADVPVSELWEGVREGDRLTFDGQKYIFNPEETLSLREKMVRKTNNLWQ